MTAARWFVSGGNMALRGVSLAARFALAIYMARDLGLYALGIFGIIAGVAGLAPSVLGFGISYYTNRALVGLDGQRQGTLLRDRTAFSLAVALALWAAGGLILALGFGPARPPAGLLLMSAIVTLEYLAFDLHVALINMARPIAANLLLFIRSASWILPAILIGLIFAPARNLDTLLHFWLAALIAHFAVIGLVFRGLDWRRLWRTPVDWRALAGWMRAAPLIYGNDVAVTAQVYLERFVVLHFLGVRETGIYTLFFSITHGVYVLAAAASTQMSLPRLMDAYRDGGARGWLRTLEAEARWALLCAIMLAATALVGGLLLLPRLGFPAFGEDAPLFALMLGVAFLRALADLPLAALYGLGFDRALALTNLAGSFLSLAAAAMLVGKLGLIGAGLAGIAVQIALIVARVVILRRWWRGRNA